MSLIHKTYSELMYFSKHRNFYNTFIRLETEEIDHPESVIATFCGDYQLFEIRQQLWDLVETALTTENSAFSEARQRESVMLFYNKLEEVLEANFAKYSAPHFKKPIKRV